MAKNRERKVSVRLYVPNGRRSVHGFPLTKPITIDRQIREDADGYPYIQYKKGMIYIRPAKFLYGCYEECDRKEARI